MLDINQIVDNINNKINDNFDKHIRMFIYGSIVRIKFIALKNNIELQNKTEPNENGRRRRITDTNRYCVIFTIEYSVMII